MVALRDRLIRNRTQLSNAIRGYAAEFGFTAARGWRTSIRCSIAFKLMRTCPSWLASCSRPKLKNMRSCRRKIAEVDAKLMAWHKADECSRRLAKIPGVGPIGAALLMMKTPRRDVSIGRQFAAWIGLTPKDHSKAGKVRLGVITRPATKPCAAC